MPVIKMFVFQHWRLNPSLRSNCISAISISGKERLTPYV